MGARTRGFANNVLTAGKIDTSDGLTGNLPNSNVNNTSVSGVTSLPPSVGSGIASVGSNPAAPVATGIVWYNTADERFKVAASSSTWHSGANMTTARYRVGGAGTQTAGLAFGGSAGNPGAQPSTSATEEYNGTGWGSGGNMNETRRGMGGAGTQTAGLAFAGSPSPSDGNTTNLCEEYDGSSWTAVNTMNTARQTFMGAGTQTAAFAAGGFIGPPGPNTNASETYDGTNWTASPGTIGTASRQGAASGTSTAGLIFSAATSPGSLTNVTQTFDGSTYTTVNPVNTARRGGGGSGSQTAALFFGGATDSPGYEVHTESWDGTSWTTTSNLATGRQFISGAVQAPSTASLAFAGFEPGATSNKTEEFNTSFNVTTAGAWASGANMNTGRGRMGGFGTQTAAVASGGYIGPPGPNTNQGENYNGTTWSVSGSPSQTNNSQNATGTQTAGILISGGNPYVNIVQTYNGSTYSTAPFSTVTRRGNGGACGTQTAGLFFAGYSSTTPPHTGPGSNGWSEEYDGEGFTNTNVMVTGRSYVVAAGSQTAALSAGGGNGPTPSGSVCEEFDGTNWTTVNNMPTTTGSGAGGGTQTAAWYAGGSTGGPGTISTNGYTYDGTNWATAPSLGTSRYILAEAGNAPNTTGLVFGGFIPSPFTGMDNTEEFTGETTALNIENITDS